MLLCAVDVGDVMYCVMRCVVPLCGVVYLCILMCDGVVMCGDVLCCGHARALNIIVLQCVYLIWVPMCGMDGMLNMVGVYIHT